MNVLVIDAIAPGGIAYLTERGFRVDQVSSKLPREELYARRGDHEAIITRSSTQLTAEFLARARRLKILGRAGVGVDNIDIEARSRHGVVVVNAYLLYERDGRRISLFVAVAAAPGRGGGTREIFEDAEAYNTTALGGIALAWWEAGEHLSAAASGAGVGEVREFARLCVLSARRGGGAG